MNDDLTFLQEAIRTARNGIKNGGGPFGALITREGRVIARAYNRVVPSHDPTAHAEVLAIREASEKLRTHDLSGCVLYASCEPCPMCLGAVYWSGIRRVVYAAGREDAAAAGFNDSFIYSEMSLDPGERKITFIRLPDAGGDEPFKEWERFGDRIPY